MKNINIINEQFKNDCQIVNLKSEYPGYTGKEEFAIITNLSETELNEKYEELLSPLKPFILMPLEFADIRDDFIKNEKKHSTRASRSINVLDISENFEVSEAPFSNAEEVITIKDIVRSAISTLPSIQKRRTMKYFFEGKTISAIAQEEDVNLNVVSKSLKTAIRNLINYFSKNGIAISVIEDYFNASFSSLIEKSCTNV